MIRGCKSLSSGLAGESKGPACGELACTGTVRVVARIARVVRVVARIARVVRVVARIAGVVRVVANNS